MGKKFALEKVAWRWLFLYLLAQAVGLSQGFDFFYLVLQWAGSYCDTRSVCCYPSTGKAIADFSIHGLWPNNNDGTWPQNCNPSDLFDVSKIEDLKPELARYWSSFDCPSNDGQEFWSHEWDKHGTCAGNLLDQHSYFEATLRLREKLDLLGALENAGMRPDGRHYSLHRIVEVLEEAVGHFVGIQCNKDEQRIPQLYQIYICVHKDASTLIDCPVLPHGHCARNVEFPPFLDHAGHESVSL